MEQAELVQLYNTVQVPVLGAVSDKWKWSLDGSGLFSVRGLKQRLQVSRFAPAGFIFKRNSWVPQKVEILAWRAELDRLPTRVSLAGRNIFVASDTCQLCGDSAETTEHLFICCGFSQVVWQLVAQWCKIGPIYAFHIKDLLELHSHIGGSAKKKKAFYAICLTTMWCIWRHRNDAVFNLKQPSIQTVLGDIKTLSFLWVKARAKQHSLVWDVWCTFNLSSIGW